MAQKNMSMAQKNNNYGTEKMIMAQKNIIMAQKNDNGTGTSLATRRFDGDNGQPEKKQVCFHRQHQS